MLGTEVLRVGGFADALRSTMYAVLTVCYVSIKGGCAMAELTVQITLTKTARYVQSDHLMGIWTARIVHVPRVQKCPKRWFSCMDGSKCIHSRFVCDRKSHCKWIGCLNSEFCHAAGLHLKINATRKL
ncbi:hypothetical protein OSTOST_05094 [Ostertagia ostertagi]